MEVYRKRRSPKRDRRASDLDDLLPVVSEDQNNDRNQRRDEGKVEEVNAFLSRMEIRMGKKVLGMSEHSSEIWTREKPSVHRAVEAPFGTRARVRGDVDMDVDMDVGMDMGMEDYQDATKGQGYF